MTTLLLRFVTALILLALCSGGSPTPAFGQKASPRHQTGPDDPYTVRYGSPYAVDDVPFDRWRDRYGSTPELEAFIAHQRRRYGLEKGTPAVRSTRPGLPAKTAFEDLQALPAQDPTGEYSYAALIALGNGDIGLAYKDWGVAGEEFFGLPLVPPRILWTRTSDGGATWTAPTVVADEADFILDYNFLQATRTASGRLLINDETPFESNHLFYSDDDGQTWTSAPITEYDGFDRLMGPVGGTIWHPFPDFETDGALKVSTSPDGLTWSEPTLLLANSRPDAQDLRLVDVASTGGSDYLALIEVFSFEPCCSSRFDVIRSTDDGATWSAPTTLALNTDGFMALTLDVFARAPDGTLWVAGQGIRSDFEADDIYYATSTDGGSTWSDLQAFTRYKGGDYLADLAFAGNTPLLAFSSDRYTAVTQLWYGIPGVTPDRQPPPAFTFSVDQVQPFWIGAGAEAPVSFAVADETGIASVEIVAERDGQTSTFPLFDDGQHHDGAAGDDLWGGTLGPFDFGLPLIYYARVTDTDGQTALSFAQPLRVVPQHDAGALGLALTSTGNFGYHWLPSPFPTLAAQWPGPEGMNYLYGGGLWIGTEGSGTAPRVMHNFYDNDFDPAFTDGGDWRTAAGAVSSAGPGRSDLDITVTYDDAGAPQPLGLRVRQTSYQWSDPQRDDFLVFVYEITNTTADADLENVYASVFLDPDMTLEGGFEFAFDDRVAYDADRGMLYAFDGGTACNDPEQNFNNLPCPGGYVGLLVLDDGTGKTGTVTPHTARAWTGETDPGRMDLDDSSFLALMRSGINAQLAAGTPTAPNDIKMLITPQPFTLPAQATRAMAFGLVMGTGLDDLRANADVLLGLAPSLPVAVEERPAEGLPQAFSLGANYPNPFNPTTTIPFTVATRATVTLRVFDALGRTVATLVDRALAPGAYDATFEAADLSSGLYFYRLEANGFSQTRSFLLMK